MRKILVLNLAFLSLLLMILTGCNSSSGDKDKSLHVLVEGGSPALEVAEKTAAEFEEQSGYKIVVDSVPYSGVYDKLKAEIDAGKATHDVAIIDVLWFPSLVDGLEPVDDVLSDEEQVDFLPKLEDGAIIENTLYGIPTWSNSKVLIYRKDLFADEKYKEEFEKEYGYELTVPTNWQEYLDVAEFFTRDGMYGTTVYGANMGDSVSSWLDHAAQAGAQPLVIDENNNVLIDQEPYVKSLEMLQELVNDESVPSETLAIAASETAELFNDGKLAMMLVWGHFYMSSSEELPDKVGVAPMIAGEKGIGAVPGPWYQVVLKDSNKKDVAKEYLKFMYEKNEEYMKSLGVASRASVFEKYEDDESYLHLNAINTTLEGSQTQNRPQISEWTQIENEVLAPMIQRVLSGADAQTELIEAKEQIEEIIGK
ncbi:hypothetical protein B4064_3520 [Caldibacillus thermoamylovorans]|uniref:ABC transporter substrate-binding protein n=1 Tax=Caldibacillus thermoamylovorans TaxID=35841 RepID=UPI0005B72A6F|nr:sugar ABC transporter substrate-binding protein [Caldibacillus thermoamylovorans]KIO60470.1 hypothetical protein B4064_3520 [Caldibacillus thermoamylovorans]